LGPLPGSDAFEKFHDFGIGIKGAEIFRVVGGHPAQDPALRFKAASGPAYRRSVMGSPSWIG
jgi:hypothetical protein